jgi:hypothetical protein
VIPDRGNFVQLSPPIAGGESLSHSYIRVLLDICSFIYVPQMGRMSSLSHVRPGSWVASEMACIVRSKSGWCSNFGNGWSNVG